MHKNENLGGNARPVRLTALAATGALALLLAGCAVTNVRGTTPAQIPPAILPADCHPDPDFDRRQYIVGYGSLMEESSRRGTSPGAGEALPVTVRGFWRGWIVRYVGSSIAPTYLGAVADAASEFNAVVYELPYGEIEHIDDRESGYCRVPIPPEQLRMYSDSSSRPGGQVWIYVAKPAVVAAPNDKYPIVQSYVDVFMRGCLQAQDLLGSEGFARDCVRTTHAWSKHWVNDRIYPRRPFVHQPRALSIDRLLKNQIPEYFNAMHFE
jgi:hypothetical protein